MKISRLIALVIFCTGLDLGAQDAVPPADGSTPPDATAEAVPEVAPEAVSADAPPPAEEEGPAIPIAYDLSRYEATWEKNPFRLKTTPTAQPTVNWAQDWTLASMSKYAGKVRISIRNKQTNELKRIYNEGKPGDEFRLVSANFNRSRKEASVKIAKGAEEAELKYDENAPPVTINNTIRTGGPQGAQPGQPNAGGMVNNAVQPGRPGGQPAITKPLSNTGNGRVFNAPNLPGGVAAQGGMVNGATNFNQGNVPMTGGTTLQPGIVNPSLPTGAPGTTPPTISRRRQLIPAPVVSPQSNP